MRRKVVFLGAFLLILGLAIMILPTQEPFLAKREVEVRSWELQEISPVLPPQDTAPGFGRLMLPGMWFQLDISSTDLIEVRISVIQHNPTTKVPVFNQEATSFNQKVEISNTGTYWVDIENTSQSTVTLEGEILAKELEATPNTSTYALLGFPFMLGGSIAMIHGILKKPKKSPRAKRKAY